MNFGSALRRSGCSSERWRPPAQRYGDGSPVDRSLSSLVTGVWKALRHANWPYHARHADMLGRTNPRRSGRTKLLARCRLMVPNPWRHRKVDCSFRVVTAKPAPTLVPDAAVPRSDGHIANAILRSARGDGLLSVCGVRPLKSSQRAWHG